MTKTTDEVIENFTIKHGDRYDYSLVNYEKAVVKVKIICRKHGIFSITPNSHLNGSGCSICGREIVSTSRKGTKESFIKKAREVHGDFYGYDLVEYNSFLGYVTIICPIHGEFKQQVRKHLSGNKCKKCTSESYYIDFVEICKNKFPQYDYSKVVYKGMYNSVIITCKLHGDFQIKPINFYHKERGCKDCLNKTKSRIEKKWLDSLDIPIDRRNKYVEFGNKIFCVDGIDYENKIAYEFYGDFFHGNPDVYNSDDINPLLKESFGDLYRKTIIKEEIIKQSGYTLVSIWENNYKFKNKNKQ